MYTLTRKQAKDMLKQLNCSSNLPRQGKVIYIQFPGICITLENVGNDLFIYKEEQ